jgi:MerR family transcriptional regulator, redox-sensitive transcriptional activator SoxR
MTIGKLAAQTGIPASTIRYYEKVGVLPRPERVSGKRRYSSEALDRLAVVRLAQACGFHIEEMRQLFRGFKAGVPASRRWHEVARKKDRELEEQAARLLAMRKVVKRVLQCHCVDFDEYGRIAASVMDVEPR